MLRVISHELRTPLASLKLQIELLTELGRRQAEAPGWADASKRIDNCTRPLNRLEHVVEELLEAARVHAGDIEVKRERVELAQLVRDCHQQLAARAAAEGCSLTLDLDERAVGSWDREKLTQVVSNLLSNAIEYGRRRPIHVTLQTQGAQAVLSLQYRGLPVSREDCERLFQPLSVPDTAHHPGGVGVGLYVSRELVRVLGGTLSLESTPEAGTTLRAALPLDGAREAGAAKVA